MSRGEKSSGRVSAGSASAGRAALCFASALALLSLAPRSQHAPLCADPEAGAELAAVLCAGQSGTPLRGATRLLFGLRLDPNRADVASLEALPGIGPARAAAIAAERCRRPFAGPADLERVVGIGPRIRAALEPWIEVETGVAARCGAVH